MKWKFNCRSTGHNNPFQSIFGDMDKLMTDMHGRMRSSKVEYLKSFKTTICIVKQTVIYVNIYRMIQTVIHFHHLQ